MSYEETTWKAGDKITSSKLNKMEKGIKTADEGISTAQAAATAAQEATSAMTGEVEAMKEAAEEMKQTVAGNSEAVAEAKAAAEAASAAAASNKTDIDNLKSDMETVKPAVAKVEANETAIGEVKSSLASLETTVGEANAAATEAKEKAEAATASVSTLTESVEENASAISEVKESIATIQQSVEEATSAAGSAVSTAGEAASSASAAHAAAEENSSAIAAMSQTLESVSQAQTSMGETVTAHGQSITSLEEKNTSIESDITTMKEKDTELETAIGNNEAQDASQNGQLSALLDRISVMEEKVNDLQKTNKTDMEITGETGATISEPDADLVITTAAPITAVTAITAKSIDVKAMEVSSSRVSFTAPTGDISLANVKNDGDLQKSVANAAFSLNTDGYVRITQSEFKQTGYNCIEIGLSNEAAPKNVLIDGLEFEGELSNNAILIFAHAPNAVITISNCHFASVSNMLRISNRNNVPAVVNISNCRIDKWDTDPDWAGALIFQDYNATTVEELEEANRFGDGKIKINFINVVGPHGKIMGAEDLSTILGSKDADKQIACMYANAGDTITPYAGHEHMWPTFTFA